MPQQQNHHRIRLVTTCVVLFLLVGAHTALISLWASHGLDKHLFSISKLSEASQVITIATQATITILLVLLSFAVQGVAADQIIRRREYLKKVIFSTRALNLPFPPQDKRSRHCRII